MYSVPKNTIFLLSVILFFLVGCSRKAVNQNRSIAPKVIDNINLLSPQVKRDIEEKCKFPDGIFVLVRTIDEFDLAKVGSYATKVMQKETHWKQVRPKGFFSTWIKQDKPWSMGVYVLVSQDPNLIQIRYGERIRLEAYRAGLAIGSKYLKIQQQFKNNGADLGTLSALKELSQELPSALNLPWYLRYGKPLVAVTFSEFEELVSPSDGMYSKWLLRPYLKLIQALGGFFSVWYFMLLNLCIYFLVRILFVHALPYVILRKSKPKIKAVWKVVVPIVVNVFFAVPFLGGVILLNGSRFEDYLALQQLGISSPDQASLGCAWYLNVTGFGLAAFITLMNYINLWISDPLSTPIVIYTYGGSQELHSMFQRQWIYRYPTFFLKWSSYQQDAHTQVIVFDEYAYRPKFSVLVFLLFMPRAIGLVGLIKESYDLVENILSKGGKNGASGKNGGKNGASP